ncbi:non-canonical purine NTP pyrophosphatase [Halobacteriales archaeon QS_5_70_15]|nr:MAG: non-canonical purine NTP pyrophosphatase [Halobacteriales archaeon QS_5_70_15]
MLRYVTTNEGKVREAREYLEAVEPLSYDYTEIQADDLGAVAAHGARDAFLAGGEDPVIVDDAGLFVERFDGFPGPYSAYVEDTLGVERVGHVAREAGATDAAFRCVIAYCDGEPFEATPEPVDHGDRRGHDLDAEVRGSAITDDTVAGGDLPVKLFKMSAAEKNAVSHRGRALAKFAEWFQSRTG